MALISGAKTPARGLVLSALITVQVLFGMNYVISKMVIDVFPSLVWASFRIIVATVVMMMVALLSGRPSPRGRDFFVPLIGLALLGTIINQTSFLIGLHYTTSTNSALLNTLIPVFTLLVVTLRGQEVLTRRKSFGFLLAFGGVLVLRKIEDFSLSNQTLRGDLLTVLNCLSYGCFLSYGKNFMQKYDRIWITAWMFLYGSIGITLMALPQWSRFHMPELNTTLLWCMAFAVIGGTLLTYFLNIWALAYTKSSSVAIFIYFQPIVAVTLAFFWLGQGITVRMVIACLFIFSGLGLTLFAPRQT